MKYRIKIHRENGVILSDELNETSANAVAEAVKEQEGFFMPMNGNTCIVGTEVVKKSLIEFVEVKEYPFNAPNPQEG